MSQLSERIRAAALGPAPKSDERSLMYWVDEDHNAWFECVSRGAYGRNGDHGFVAATNDVRRMFLLFVAEAVK